MKLKGIKSSWENIINDDVKMNRCLRYANKGKSLLLSLFKAVILSGIAFIILGPVISIVSNSFFSPTDVYNPSVFLFPLEPHLGNYKLAALRLDYFRTLGNSLLYIAGVTLIQIFITSMAGYGFARFEFPLKKLLFACVVVTIILPSHTIMLPLYRHFRSWDVLGIISLFRGEPLNLLQTQTPMYILSLFASGLRSGLYIYIFRQFFRGLPKEIEEAALIDGAGTFYTYFRIMLVNAMPAVLTVGIFSMVWQYNDMFYVQLFTMPMDKNLTFRLSTIQSTIEFVDRVKDPLISQLYVYAGVVLALIPVLIFYLFLQRYFMEGLERSGIVG